jgi:hypothetical protein
MYVDTQRILRLDTSGVYVMLVYGTQYVILDSYSVSRGTRICEQT